MSSVLGDRPLDLRLAAVSPIMADASRVEQVILNLLQNACRYSAPNAPIEIELTRNPQGVRIGVLDRGVGLTPVDAERIFEPFYRAGKGTSANAGGAGLGLAICRSIVETHGGRMWAESRPEGGMAMFLTLPLEAQATVHDAVTGQPETFTGP
jgi:two-component system, OmpR family, sensor histidine kinase KdpD